MEKPTYEELVEALKLANSHLYHSEESTTSYAIYQSPANKLRERADEIEKKDTDILKIRGVIGRT